MKMKETIQVKTDGHGWEKLCQINQENTFVQGNGFSHKCNLVLAALTEKYKDDEFRVLEKI
jgi:hypothetical protein